MKRLTTSKNLEVIELKLLRAPLIRLLESEANIGWGSGG